jgi:hypothetical protein
LDPFGGVSNTAVACNKLGVSCTTIEIDPQYVTLARLQMQSCDNQEAWSAGTGTGEKTLQFRILSMIDVHFCRSG